MRGLDMEATESLKDELRGYILTTTAVVFLLPVTFLLGPASAAPIIIRSRHAFEWLRSYGTLLSSIFRELLPRVHVLCMCVPGFPCQVRS